MNKVVSIIMPSYNTEKFISLAIDSVISQSYSNWELIVIDDCSTDKTDSIMDKYRHEKRIRYIKNDHNLGAAESRNRALREAKGKWIAFLDSDDMWHPEKLMKQIRFMEENSFHFSYTEYSEIDDNGKLNGVTVSGPERITHNGFLNYCWPGCLTVMYDRDYVGLVQIGKIRKNNDYAVWLKVSKKTNCYLLKETLAYYRRGRKGSISTNSAIKMIKWHYRLFRDEEKNSIVRSLFNTSRNMLFGYYKKNRYVKRHPQG